MAQSNFFLFKFVAKKFEASGGVMFKGRLQLSVCFKRWGHSWLRFRSYLRLSRGSMRLLMAESGCCRSRLLMGESLVSVESGFVWVPSPAIR